MFKIQSKRRLIESYQECLLKSPGVMHLYVTLSVIRKGYFLRALSPDESPHTPREDPISRLELCVVSGLGGLFQILYPGPRVCFHLEAFSYVKLLKGPVFSMRTGYVRFFQ